MALPDARLGVEPPVVLTSGIKFAAPPACSPGIRWLPRWSVPCTLMGFVPKLLMRNLRLFFILFSCLAVRVCPAPPVETWHEWVTPERFSALCVELARNVDLFQRIWEEDPGAPCSTAGPRGTLSGSSGASWRRRDREEDLKARIDAPRGASDRAPRVHRRLERRRRHLRRRSFADVDVGAGLRSRGSRRSRPTGLGRGTSASSRSCGRATSRWRRSGSAAAVSRR